MNEQKSLLTRLGETLDQYRAERRRTAQERMPSGRAGWLHRLLPTPGNVIFTLVMIALLVAAQSVGAIPLRSMQYAVPASTATIAYQGRLANAAGEPLTGTYSMIFRLYDVATGGTPLWTEQWTGSNSVRVSDGLFNVMLGSLNRIEQNMIAGHDQLWLGITVGTDDEMQPRVQLGSVPFAVQALTVPDGSITTVKIANGAVTAAKQTAVTFRGEDNTFVRLQGQVTDKTISEFHFDNVPAGEVEVIATLISWVEPGANNRGSVWIEAAGKWLDTIPTHVLTTQYTLLVLHGRLSNFSGGTLVVRVAAGSEVPEVNIGFGASNGDHRFGRRVTIIAGL